jgi:predicted transcriptional regulator
MSKYTALLDSETAEAFDELALRARRAKGRRVEKAEIVRALIMLAADDASLRDQIIGQLPDEAPARSSRGAR